MVSFRNSGKDSDLVGKPAPPLSLPGIPDGKLYTLPLGIKPIVLFFFPKAMSAGCTVEACSFRDARANNATFKRHDNLEVVGISSDKTELQQTFSDQYNLAYPIISDADGTARKAYGVGKAFLGLVSERMTVFIDGTGIVRGVFVANLDMHGHVKFVEDQLKALDESK